MRLFLLYILSAIFISQPASAENPPAQNSASSYAAALTGDFGNMKHTMSGRVDKIVDASTLLLKDGKLVRLLAVAYPTRAGEVVGPVMLAAKDRLEELLPGGTEIVIWQSFNSKTGRMNRMGHLLAHIALKKDGRWINGTLVCEGLGWTVTDASNPEMAGQLYALEEDARLAQRGLWSEKLPFGVIDAFQASEGNGSFRIVQGTIVKAATSRNNLYLNFGPDRKTDFTVMVPPELRKRFARNGVDPMSLGGSEVRVRGWIREWNGPFMELETAERLEILSKLKSTDLPTVPSPGAVDKSR